MNFNKKRPVFLDLLKIDMPATAILSIGHRISGILLFLSIPFFLYLFDLSLTSEEGFDQARSILNQGFIKFLCVMLLWGLIHHLLAGIRFLLLDMHIGMSKQAASKSAWLVHVTEIVSLLIAVFILL